MIYSPMLPTALTSILPHLQPRQAAVARDSPRYLEVRSQPSVWERGKQIPTVSGTVDYKCKALRKLRHCSFHCGI